MFRMKGIIRFLPIMLLLVPGLAYSRNVVSRAARITNTPTSGYTYNYMYPYLNGKMRSGLNPGDANAQSTSPINVVVKTTPLPYDNVQTNTSRRVVSRSGRVATSGGKSNTSNTMVARAGVGSYATSGVGARGVRARSGRTDTSTASTVVTSKATSQYVSSSRCLADYTECMNSYCERSDTEYNRCFCSAKLAQINSKYQSRIDSLVQQIIRLQYNSVASSDEIKSYWNATVGTYTNTNPWVNIDNALNIDWASTESRVRGQNAFITGHSYCVNYLRSCSYMASNLRDAYKSEIERDCATYEKDLSRIQIAAESVIESYNQ